MTGGCVCGAVRYEISAKPLAMFCCHCRTCQIVSGGAYTPIVLVPNKAFKLTQGAIKHHFTDSKRGEKHPHKRGFCTDCGSRLTGGESIHPRPWMAVTASSLDDPSIFKSQFDIFASHAQAWDRLDPNVPKHAEYPPK